MARKTYTREFKLQAVRMMTDQGLSVAEVARRLGVGENCLRNWRAASQEKGAAALPRPRNPSPAPGRGGAGRRRGRGRALSGREGSPKKGPRLLRPPAELTFQFIAGQRGECPVSWACDALEVSESGFHAWANRPASPAEARRGQ